MAARISTSLLLILFCSFQATDTFEGKVVGVIDGDTIEVMRDTVAIRVRLNGIDCPEHGQPFAKSAKDLTSSLVFNRTVKVRIKEIDKYGRTIADVYLKDGTWVNHMIVEFGLAWHYKFFSDNESLALAEIKARKEKMEIWSDPNPVAPWDFRKTK